MFIVVQTLEEDYLDLNIQKVDYIQHCTWRKPAGFYRIYIGQANIDISEEVYTSTLEPVLYPGD